MAVVKKLIIFALILAMFSLTNVSAHRNDPTDEPSELTDWIEVKKVSLVQPSHDINDGFNGLTEIMVVVGVNHLGHGGNVGKAEGVFDSKRTRDLLFGGTFTDPGKGERVYTHPLWGECWPRAPFRVLVTVLETEGNKTKQTAFNAISTIITTTLSGAKYGPKGAAVAFIAGLIRQAIISFNDIDDLGTGEYSELGGKGERSSLDELTFGKRYVTTSGEDGGTIVELRIGHDGIGSSDVCKKPAHPPPHPPEPPTAPTEPSTFPTLPAPESPVTYTPSTEELRVVNYLNKFNESVFPLLKEAAEIALKIMPEFSSLTWEDTSAKQKIVAGFKKVKIIYQNVQNKLSELSPPPEAQKFQNLIELYVKTVLDGVDVSIAGLLAEDPEKASELDAKALEIGKKSIEYGLQFFQEKDRLEKQYLKEAAPEEAPLPSPLPTLEGEPPSPASEKKGAPFDFSLSAGGNKLVIQGHTATNGIRAALKSGKSERVSFSVSGLPPKTKASFLRFGCKPICETNLDIQTSESTPVGKYIITVTGKAGGFLGLGALERSARFALNVSPAAPVTLETAPTPEDSEDSQIFDFYLKSEPGEVSVVQGKTANTYITGGLIVGDYTALKLSVSGLPAGATASFYPTNGRFDTSTFSCRLQPFCYASIAIKTSPGTAVGKYPITITGKAHSLITGGDYTRTVKFNLNVASAVAPVPAGALFDFSFNPLVVTSITRRPGESVSGLEISVKPKPGSPAQVVTFSVEGLPPGITPFFSPDSGCVMPCAVALSFKIPITTDGGDYPVTIIGKAGGLTKTTSFTLALTPYFDFYLKSEPAEVTVSRGQTFDIGITGSLIVGDFTTAKLSVSGLPAGATASFYPPGSFDPSTFLCRLQTSCFPSLRIKTSLTTPAGKYPVTVTGKAHYLKTGGDYTRTTKFILTIKP